MKLAENIIDIETSDDLKSAGFGFEFNAKMADMLSNKIYSDPILAVVREYIGNAVDAQNMTSIVRPIHIQVPTMLDPTWEVRDYGPGLSQEDVMGTAPDFHGLFNTYGYSNKTHTNKAIGGFGLGSKAGFAYTGSDGAFNVISWHGGQKKTYVCHRNSEGLPTVSLMNTETSAEPTGVKISIPVKSDDTSTFIRKTKQIIKYIDSEFTFSGTDENLKEPVKYILEGDGWGIRHSGQGYSANVIIGGIAYPVSSNQIEDGVTDKDIYRYPIDIHIPIGSVELSVSREQLSYEKKTKDFLSSLRTDILLDIKKAIEDSLENAENVYEASQFLWAMEYTVMRDLVRDIGKNNLWKGQKYLPKMLRYSARGTSYTTYHWRGTKASLAEYRKPRHENKADALDIGNYRDALFIWADVKGPKAKVKQRLYQYFLDNKKDDDWCQDVVFITASSKFSFLRSFGEYLRYTNWRVLSEMPKYEGNFFDKPKDDTDNDTTYVRNVRAKDDLVRSVATWSFVGWGGNKAHYTSVDVDFADNSVVRFYSPTCNYTLQRDFDNITQNGVENKYTMRDFDTFLDNFFEGQNQLFAIPKTYRKYVEDDPMWVNIWDVVEDISKYSKVDAAYVNAYNYYNMNYRSKETIEKAYSLGLVRQGVKDKYKKTLLYFVDKARGYQYQVDQIKSYKGSKKAIIDFAEMANELGQRWPFLEYIPTNMASKKNLLDNLDEYVLLRAEQLKTGDKK